MRVKGCNFTRINLIFQEISGNDYSYKKLTFWLSMKTIVNFLQGINILNKCLCYRLIMLPKIIPEWWIKLKLIRISRYQFLTNHKNIKNCLKRRRILWKILFCYFYGENSAIHIRQRFIKIKDIIINNNNKYLHTIRNPKNTISKRNDDYLVIMYITYTKKQQCFMYVPLCTINQLINIITKYVYG